LINVTFGPTRIALPMISIFCEYRVQRFSVSLSNHTMSYTQREVLVAPSPTDSVEITPTDPTGFDFNIYVVIAEWFRGELIEVELRPFGGVFDLEALEGFWVDHSD
jgi:hypothetical protein